MLNTHHQLDLLSLQRTVYAQGVQIEIAKRAKAQGLPDTPQVKEAMRAAEEKE